MPALGVRGARWDILEEQENANKKAQAQAKMKEAMSGADGEAKKEYDKMSAAEAEPAAGGLDTPAAYPLDAPPPYESIFRADSSEA